MSWKYEFSEQLIREMYFKQGKNQHEIAKELGCCQWTIADYFRKHDINCKSVCKNLQGTIFGRLIVVKEVLPRKKNKHRNWLCVCINCDKDIIAGHGNLTSGNTTSCGCKNYKGYKTLSGRYFTFLKKSAKERFLQFLISIKDIWDIYEKQDGKCALSGLSIDFARNCRDIDNNTASVDRIDNNKGYTKDNIQILHKIMNFMKYTFSQEEIIIYCNLVAKLHPVDVSDIKSINSRLRNNVVCSRRKNEFDTRSNRSSC